MNSFKKLIYLILFIGLAKYSRSDDNKTNTAREARASGYTNKLYSESKGDPVMCRREGFLADPNDCAVFYRCIKSFSDKYAMYKFKCGPGTVYDPDTEICNHAGNTRRIECGGNLADRNIENEIEGQELPTPITTKLPTITNTVSQNYVTAIKYPGFVSPTPPPTYYPLSPENMSLVSLESSYSNPFTSNNVPPSKIDKAPTLMTTVALQTTTSKEIYTGENKQKDDECTKDGFMGDSKNCRKFYRCVNNNHKGFIRYEFLCSDLTIWDDDLQSCNHPWAVRRKRCDSGDDMFLLSNLADANAINKPNPVYGDKELSKPKQPLSNNITQNKTQNSIHDKHTFKPITENTHSSSQVTTSPVTKYTISTSRTPSAFTDNYNTLTTFETHYTEIKPLTGGSQKNQTKESVQSNTSNECSDNGFMGDVNDCSKFYRCVGNGRGRFIKYEFKCSDGTVWDSNLDSCNYAWAVKECGGKRKSTSANNIDKNISSITSSSKPVTVNTQESSAYTAFEPIDKIYSGDTCISIGIFGDPNDCRIFFRCVDDGQGKFVKYVYKCDKGTFWDTTTQSCNYNIDKSNSCSQLDNNKTLIGAEATESFTSVSVLQSTTTKVENNINFEIDNVSNYMPIKVHTSTKRSINRNTICQMSGFFGDVNDCKTFYRCVDDGNGNFIEHAFSCGEGTVWDSSIEACNHAWAVKNCGERSSTSKVNLIYSTTSSYNKGENDRYNEINNVYSTFKNDITTSKTTAHEKLKTTRSVNTNICTEAGFIGDTNDCSKFYRCVDDGKGSYIQYEFSCGDGTAWDPKLEACNHKWAVDNCNFNKEENFDSASESTSVIMAQTTKVYETTITSSSKPTIASSTQSSNNVCNSEGFHFDSTDCRRFYRCVGDGRGAYIKYEFKCSDGTAWNREINACDYLDNTSCYTNDTKNDVNPTTSAMSQKLTTESSPKIEMTATNEKNLCKSDGFYANTEDCTKFYRCVNDGKGGFIKYDFSCGDGTIWVQENQICDHSTGISNCSSTTSSETESSTINNYSTSTYSTTKTAHITTTTQKQVENYDTDCNSEGFYPHESDCQKFYRCVNEGNGKYTKYDFTCGEGTAWDTNIQACNHLSEVKRCEYDESINQKPEERPPLQDEPQESDSNNNVNTTKPPRSTTISNNTEKSTKPTITESNKTPGSTEKTTTTTKSTKPSNKDECNEDGYFGSNSNCKNFYRCVSNQNGGYTKYDFTCGEGTIWDQTILGCNHPENVLNVSCKSSNNNEATEISSSSKPDTSSTTDQTTSTSSSQTSSTQASIDSSEDTNGNQSKNDTFTCTEAGFYANPNNCKKFYRCVDWDNKGERFSIFHFDCGEGTAWDQSLLTCNHEYAVNCSKQSENTTEKTSTTTEATETSTQPSTTTKRSTTQSSTTTTKKPTTQNTTTQQTATTQESTPQETTTQEATTQKTTTQKTTTQETTTQKSTTSIEQSTTSEPATEETSTTSTTTTTESTTSSTSSSQETTTTEQSTTTTTEKASSTTTLSPDQSTQTEKTTTQDSTTESTTTEAQTESTTESLSNKDCPQTSENEYLFVCPTSFRRHPKYCNLFYQCTEDEDTHESKIASFHCPNNTIYDEDKIQCVEEKKANKKCDGEMAARRRVKRLGYNYKEPITVGKEKMSCKMAGYYLFEKSEECSPAFLKCESTKTGNVKGFVYKCPKGYLYWTISRRCEPNRKIKDCKRSSFDWSERNELPIEKLNVAV